MGVQQEGPSKYELEGPCCGAVRPPPDFSGRPRYAVRGAHTAFPQHRQYRSRLLRTVHSCQPRQHSGSVATSLAGGLVVGFSFLVRPAPCGAVVQFYSRGMRGCNRFAEIVRGNPDPRITAAICIPTRHSCVAAIAPECRNPMTRATNSSACSIWVQCPHRPNTWSCALSMACSNANEFSTGMTRSSRP